MKHRGMVSAPKLPSDFLECRPRDLSYDVHSQLAREREDLSMAANLEIRVAHFGEMELLADPLPDRFNRPLQFLRFNDAMQRL